VAGQILVNRITGHLTYQDFTCPVCALKPSVWMLPSNDVLSRSPFWGWHSMIRFNCKLRSHGWAVAVVGDEHSEVSVTASYVNDALYDFVEAVVSLFGTERSECIWEIEPGRF